jgi:hypothetical protein
MCLGTANPGLTAYKNSAIETAFPVPSFICYGVEAMGPDSCSSVHVG